MKLLQLLFIIVLILFPFGEVLRFDVGNNVVLKPLDLFVGLTGLWWFLLLFFRHPELVSGSQKEMMLKQVQHDKISKLLFLFILICCISLIINSTWLKPLELVTAGLYLLRWFAYAMVFFIVIAFNEHFKNIIKKLLVIDGLLIVVAGFVQYFFYNNLRNLYYLGWDEHLYRLFSVFLDPNFAGSFFVLYFLFIGSILYKKIQHKDYHWFLFYSGILVTTVIALLLTFSRSALLMFIVSIVTALILLKKKKFIFVLFACLLLFFLIISPWFYLENINPLRTASSEARVETARHALQIIHNHPIIGVGFNAYRYAQIHYGFREEQSRFPSHADAGVDNSFLFVLATTGGVGFVSYLFMWHTLISSRLTATRSKNIFAVVVVASVAGLFVNALFINSLFFTPLMLWMWILLGLSNGSGFPPSRE